MTHMISKCVVYRYISLLVFIMIALGVSQQALAEHIVNGGFETGNFAGWTLHGDPQNFVASGDTHSGKYHAVLGQPGSMGSLSQTLVTTVGASYTLSFWLASNHDKPSEFTVSVGGKRLLDLVNPQLYDYIYRQYRLRFTANSTSTVISFGFRDDAPVLGLFLIDDVSVVDADASK
jgi:Carbohydrate binding domain